MSDSKKPAGGFLRNLSSNWLGYGGSVVVAFVLSPYVVHTLGQEGYGVWSVLNSVTGYLGLVDIGVRVSTGRYINYHLGRGERSEAERIVSTALALYTIAGIALLVIAVLLGATFSRLFPQLPSELALEARWILPLLSVNLCLTLYTSTFAQVLTAENRFLHKNGIDLLVLGVRSAGTVLVLRRGSGLEGLALVTLASSLLQTLLFFWLARRAHALDIRVRGASWAAGRRMLSYGAWSFVFNAGTRLVSYTDTIVVAFALGAQEVAVYSIALMLLNSGISLVSDVVGVMTPDIYKLAGRGDLASLHKAVVVGARRSMFFAIPVLVGFAMMGREFIALWMGPAYATGAGVLSILAVGYLGTMAGRGCGAAAWGLGRVDSLAQAKILEGLANLVLSFVLAKYFGLGLYGVALGTLIPMVCVEWVFVPVFSCRLLDLRLATYLRQTMPDWVLVSFAFAAICWGIDSALGQSGWLLFFGKVATACALYLPLGLKGVLHLEHNAPFVALRKIWRVAPAAQSGPS